MFTFICVIGFTFTLLLTCSLCVMAGRLATESADGAMGVLDFALLADYIVWPFVTVAVVVGLCSILAEAYW